MSFYHPKRAEVLAAFLQTQHPDQPAAFLQTQQPQPLPQPSQLQHYPQPTQLNPLPHEHGWQQNYVARSPPRITQNRHRISQDQIVQTLDQIIQKLDQVIQKLDQVAVRQPLLESKVDRLNETLVRFEDWGKGFLASECSTNAPSGYQVNTPRSPYPPDGGQGPQAYSFG